MSGFGDVCYWWVKYTVLYGVCHSYFKIDPGTHCFQGAELPENNLNHATIQILIAEIFPLVQNWKQL